MIKLKEYICKIAIVDEMECKWNYEIKKHKSPNWKIWETESIERVKDGRCISYYGMLNGKIICQATAILDKSVIQNCYGLVDEKFESVNAFIDELKKYIHYYNNERISLKLKGMSPVQYRTHSLAI